MKVETNLFVWCNSIASAFGIAWAYTSYKYNWLNVGGGETDLKEFWIAASSIVPYMALFIWLVALVLVASHDWRGALTTKKRIYRLATTFATTPVALSVADWLFHIGFPTSPV